MSSAFTTAVNLEYIICIHKETLNLIYSTTAPGISLDRDFLDNFQRSIASGAIELPGAEGDITQAMIKGKFAVIRAGRYESVAIVLKQNPDRFTREALHAFGIKFSSRWARELKMLSTDLQGDISIFQRRALTGGTVDELVEDCFHLSLVNPRKPGMPPEKFKGLHNTV